MENSTEIITYRAKNGSLINAISLDSFRAVLQELKTNYHISALQIGEAAAFSMAMVVRFALGLDAKGGEVLGLTRCCLSGVVAVAALRHLKNSGASIMIGIESEPDPEAAEKDPLLHAYLSELEALNALDCPIFIYPQVSQEELENGINNSHNVILGLFDERTDNQASELSSIIDSLNESATPIHCIGAPLGFNPDNGSYFANPLYASSTMSLGVPLNGCSKAGDLLGRHYVCDISLPKKLKDSFNIDGEGLFSEQPVVSIE